MKMSLKVMAPYLYVPLRLDLDHLVNFEIIISRQPGPPVEGVHQEVEGSLGGEKDLLHLQGGPQQPPRQLVHCHPM